MRGRGLRAGLALGLALTLVAAACGGDDDDDAAGGDTETTAGGGDCTPGEGSIWVLLPDSATSPRWETDDRRFFKASFEEAGLSDGADFTIVNAEGDAVQQQAQAEQAVADGASVVLLVELDSGSGASIIETVREGGARIINYDRQTLEGDGADVYVSFNNEVVGQKMAEVLEPLIDDLGVDTPRVVMLNGGPTDGNSAQFKKGYAATVDARVEAGDWELVADEDTPDWDNQEALRIMEQVLVGADNDVNAVFAANDGLAQSAITAMESAGLDVTQIPVSGQDAGVGGIQNVLAGKQAMSVYKPIKDEAEAAAAVALALRDCESLESVEGDWELTETPVEPTIPYIALTPIAVTKDNVADTVIADGFRTWDELCTGEFEQYCPEDRS
jgi:D-xylose transport system substrate-binding protein